METAKQKKGRLASPETLAKQAEWRKVHTWQLNMRFNYENDADIIERLQSVGKMAPYIKGLIRADIQADRFVTESKD